MREEVHRGDRPLMVRVLVGLRRRFLFERLHDPDEDARQRAGWPVWRRAVRPIGAVAWWIGALPNMITGRRARIDDPYAGLVLAANVVVVCCIAIWAVDKIRDHRGRAT